MGEGGGMGRIEEKETSAQDEPTNLTPPNLGTVNSNKDNQEKSTMET